MVDALPLVEPANKPQCKWQCASLCFESMNIATYPQVLSWVLRVWPRPARCCSRLLLRRYKRLRILPRSSPNPAKHRNSFSTRTTGCFSWPLDKSTRLIVMPCSRWRKASQGSFFLGTVALLRVWHCWNERESTQMQIFPQKSLAPLYQSKRLAHQIHLRKVKGFSPAACQYSAVSWMSTAYHLVNVQTHCIHSKRPSGGFNGDLFLRQWLLKRMI